MVIVSYIKKKDAFLLPLFWENSFIFICLYYVGVCVYVRVCDVCEYR